MRKILPAAVGEKPRTLPLLYRPMGFPADARAKSIIGAANGILGGALACRGGCDGNSDLKRWGHDDLSS